MGREWGSPRLWQRLQEKGVGEGIPDGVRHRRYGDVHGRDSLNSKIPGVRDVLPFLSLLEIQPSKSTSINALAHQIFHFASLVVEQVWLIRMKAFHGLWQLEEGGNEEVML